MNVKKNNNNLPDKEKNNMEIKWYDRPNKDFNVHGLYWFNQNKSFCRLLETTQISENVTWLSHYPSGAFLSFMTDSSTISLRVKLSSAAYMPHMSACGQCGLDLYFLHNNKFIFLTTTKINQPEYELTLVDNLPQKMRCYRLYLPTYTKLIDIAIGVKSNSTCQPWGEYHPEAVVCYGTSITQGGCVTRPGMNYTSLLGRQIPYEIYNLGFSGSAKLEKSIAEEIVKIKEMKYLIIEAEANCEKGNLLQDRLPVFLDVITSAHKSVKIYVISHYPNSDSLLRADVKKMMLANANIQKNICALYDNVEFVDGKKLLKNFSYEETVDGIHLTDLGFYTIAKTFSKKFKKKND
ncbi:MAG TPA: SGNH/GDSL hydrolase family protein [Bacilli bacterium]|nr:SGNH/GDSL hydrolase family protein [Bacilli bacterium]